jgi:serine/threonine protein kinase
MSLTSGSKLGPYEIQSPLGAGGMGEVYSATQNSLGRQVAIKVLASASALDPERLRRFEQEARAASALNHPNIISIYDVGRDGATSYIAMELVDGKTLRALLEAGPLGIKKALQIATQIADGLAKAHAAGIVHRDLKPENVMVSRDGFVKILDFGLAKLLPSLDNSSEAMTAVTPGTHPGMVMGTAGYMSPEQARGGEIDYRSDIFSFGSMPYEMVAGKQPFKCASTAQTLARPRPARPIFRRRPFHRLHQRARAGYRPPEFPLRPRGSRENPGARLARPFHRNLSHYARRQKDRRLLHPTLAQPSGR